MKNFITITVRNQTIKFYPNGNKNGHSYEMHNGHGFYTKDLFKVWGRPTKKNAVEVCNSYLESHEGRIKTFDSYKTN
jgi:hypothetical protein